KEMQPARCPVHQKQAPAGSKELGSQLLSPGQSLLEIVVQLQILNLVRRIEGKETFAKDCLQPGKGAWLEFMSRGMKRDNSCPRVGCQSIPKGSLPLAHS